MKELFNMDNPVWNFMGKLVDMLFLTGLWVLCSLPVITIGSSTAALYYVMLKLAKDQEGHLMSDFFRAFKENLRQGTAAWLLVLAAGMLLSTDLYVAYHMKGKAGILLLWAFAVLTFVYLMTVTYLFPLMARCRTTLKQLFAMAFVMAIRNFGWTLFMIVSAGCLIMIGIFVAAPILAIAVGGIAYLHAKILNMLWRESNLESI